MAGNCERITLRLTGDTKQILERIYTHNRGRFLSKSEVLRAALVKMWRAEANQNGRHNR